METKTWYTDGSCKGNPGPGGWAAVSIDNNIARFLYGYEDHTTNNRMELQGILELCKLAERDSLTEYIIYSDSSYCVDTINSWMWAWAKNDWKLIGKEQSVENLDLIQPLYEYFKRPFFNVAVRKVPGHANVLGNELADRLACNKINEFYNMLEKNNIYRETVEVEILPFDF